MSIATQFDNSTDPLVVIILHNIYTNNFKLNSFSTELAFSFSCNQTQTINTPPQIYI